MNETVEPKAQWNKIRAKYEEYKEALHKTEEENLLYFKSN